LNYNPRGMYGIPILKWNHKKIRFVCPTLRNRRIICYIPTYYMRV